MKETNKTVYTAQDGVTFNNKKECELYEKSFKISFSSIIEEHFKLFDENFNPISELYCGKGRKGDYALKIKEVSEEIKLMFSICFSYNVQSQSPEGIRPSENIDCMLRSEIGELFQRTYEYDHFCWERLPNKQKLLKERQKINNILSLYKTIEEEG